MQPTRVDLPPDGDEWQHEIKYDGFRTQVIVADGRARLYTRRGRDWSARCGSVAAIAAALPCRSAAIDGEMILPDHAGHVSFRQLRAATKGAPQRFALVAFDLLHFDGEDLRGLPLFERRRLLRDLLAGQSGAIQFSEELPGGGPAIYAAVARMGLEGMVSKRRASPYRSGATTDWLKTKCYDVGEFEIVGVERGPGKVAVALLNKDGRYAGAADIRLSRRQRDRLWARVEAKQRPAPHFLAATRPKAAFVGPGLIASVRFLKGEPTLTQATVQDFRELQ